MAVTEIALIDEGDIERTGLERARAEVAELLHQLNLARADHHLAHGLLTVSDARLKTLTLAVVDALGEELPGRVRKLLTTGLAAATATKGDRHGA